MTSLNCCRALWLFYCVDKVDALFVRFRFLVCINFQFLFVRTILEVWLVVCLELRFWFLFVFLTAEPKTFDFDLPKGVGINLKHQIYFIIKHNDLLAEHQQKARLGNYCANMSMETIFINIESSKTNELQKFVLNLSQRLNLKSLNKHVSHQSLSIFLHLEKYKTTVQKQ